MNQISIKSSACNTPEVKIRLGVKSPEMEIKPAEKIVSIPKFCAVTYLDFLHARIIHDGTLNNMPFLMNLKFY